MTPPAADWFAEWQVAARNSQRMPKSGRPWTQAHFLEQLEADTGWRLHRSNLSAYENGRQKPEPETLERFTRFWRKYGVEPPDPHAPQPEPPVDPVVAAIDRQTDAITRLADSLAPLADLVQALQRRSDLDDARDTALSASLGDLAKVLHGLEKPVSDGRDVPGRAVLGAGQ